MIDLYKHPWDKISHAVISFFLSLLLGPLGFGFALGWFHSREYSTATRYMNSRSLKLLPPWAWEWEPIKGKPTAEDSRWDFYAALAGGVTGLSAGVYLFGGV